MSKRYSYVLMASPIPRTSDGDMDMDIVCDRCSKRFGWHIGLKCPDMRGVFSKNVRRLLESKKPKALKK